MRGRPWSTGERNGWSCGVPWSSGCTGLWKVPLPKNEVVEGVKSRGTGVDWGRMVVSDISHF